MKRQSAVPQCLQEFFSLPELILHTRVHHQQSSAIMVSNGVNMGNYFNYGRAYHWEATVRLSSCVQPAWIIICPFQMPNIEGVYCKVILENPDQIRMFFNFKSLVSRHFFERLQMPGEVTNLVPWTGSFWNHVDVPVANLQEWQLGVQYKPRRSTH